MRRLEWSTILLLALLLSSMVWLVSCEEMASNLTNRTIENLENEVGGAAERASQNAGNKAGGEICGAPLAVTLVAAAAWSVPVSRRMKKTSSVQISHAATGSQFKNQDQSEKQEQHHGQ